MSAYPPPIFIKNESAYYPQAVRPSSYIDSEALSIFEPAPNTANAAAASMGRTASVPVLSEGWLQDLLFRFPAALLPGNAAASEATEVPCTAFDCDSAIPPAPEFTMMLSACVAVCALLSVAFTVKLLVPAAVGVPEITPVLAASDMPVGSVPETTDQVYGVVPPLAASVVL